MRKVFYKGSQYTGYLQVGSKSMTGEWCWDLHKDGQLVHKAIKTNELDIKSIVGIILDTYYEQAKREKQ